MTDSIADDFSFIAARMRELRGGGAAEEEEVCARCEGGGWECYGTGHMDPHFRECEVCRNPNDLKSP